MFHNLLLPPAFVSTWFCPFLLPVDAGHDTEKRRRVDFMGKMTRCDQADGKMLQVRHVGVTFSQARDTWVKYFE